MDFESLIQQPESRRDQRWELEFLDGLAPRRVEVEAPEPSPGPDGWPYLRVRAGREDAGEPFQRIVRWLSGRGIGLVVNAHKMMPDYVFTYGMIWNFVETGRFIEPRAAAPRGPVEFGPGVLTGEPTPKYLPPSVRAILREFLGGHGLKDVRLVVATTPDYKQTDLILTTESLGSPKPAEANTLAEALHWFLPQHYNLVFASAAGLPATFPL